MQHPTLRRRALGSASHPLLLATMLATLAGCQDQLTPSAPAAPALIARAPLGTLVSAPASDRHERHFRDLAAEIPGFAGTYLDRNGTLVIALTRDERREQARERVLDRLAASGRNRAALAGRGIRFSVVRYSFEQLAAWREAIVDDVLDLPSASLLDLDEVENRLVIGVEGGTPDAAVLQILARAGIPSSAVSFEAASPVVPAQSSYYDNTYLTGRVRPLMGGTVIAPKDCTGGVTAIWQGQQVLLTNSHCSASVDQLDSGWWSQPNYPANYDNLGTEVWDTYGWDCKVTFYNWKRCRHADLAAYSVTGGMLMPGESQVFTLGRIARPTTRRHGPTTGNSAGNVAIDAANPYFVIAGTYQYPLANEVMDKIGKFTGWTYGAIYKTCTDRDAPGDRRIVCADAADTGADGGDSGGPVFMRIGYAGPPESVVFMGLTFAKELSGTGMWFSNVQQIGRELGSFQVTP